MNNEANVTRKPDYVQVCVWSATVVGANNIEEFEQFFLDEMNTRVQYLEEIETGPDYKDGRPVPDTGGRNDLFFAVHKDDVMNFAVPRLAMGIRWIEDCYLNADERGDTDIWPARCHEYNSWDEV